MKNRTVKHELTPLQQSLFSQLIDIMLVDKRRLSARIHGIGKIKSQEAQQAVAAEIQQQIEQARLTILFATNDSRHNCKMPIAKIAMVWNIWYLTPVSIHANSLGSKTLLNPWAAKAPIA